MKNVIRSAGGARRARCRRVRGSYGCSDECDPTGKRPGAAAARRAPVDHVWRIDRSQYPQRDERRCVEAKMGQPGGVRGISS